MNYFWKQTKLWSPSPKLKHERRPYRDFGKGGGQPAMPNFGDCFAYTLAKLKEGTNAIWAET